MKKLALKGIGFLLLLIVAGLNESKAQYEGTGSNLNTEYVEGYYRDNGTYVEGYYRTESNSYNLDNFNAEGNYNPYSGEYGDVEYESPYNSYYSREYDTDLNSTDYNNNTDIEFDLDY